VAVILHAYSRRVIKGAPDLNAVPGLIVEWSASHALNIIMDLEGTGDFFENVAGARLRRTPDVGASYWKWNHALR
jgi:hypothetical protein